MSHLRILLAYYHPIIFDLKQTFEKLGHEVTVCVNIKIKDNYGTGLDIVKNQGTITLQQALNTIDSYDLVGCDGVFDGDKLLLDLCEKRNKPTFCINGYPHNPDEPSKNILSFSWFLPQIRYKQKYPSEGHIKEIDWKNLATQGKTDDKNICVFYPNMWEAKKQFMRHLDCGRATSVTYSSIIHKYEECNRWCYDTFKLVKNGLKDHYIVENIEGKSKQEVLDKLFKSRGLLHLKHGDCPGIAVLEAMLFGAPVFTVSSFVLASFNQDLLIDGYSAVVADTVDELIMRMKGDEWQMLSVNARQHALTLTSFDRQKNKLITFLERCVQDV